MQCMHVDVDAWPGMPAHLHSYSKMRCTHDAHTYCLLPPPHPLQKENEAILFGGEFYDGDKDKTYVYAVRAGRGRVQALEGALSGNAVVRAARRVHRRSTRPSLANPPARPLLSCARTCMC